MIVNNWLNESSTGNPQMNFGEGRTTAVVRKKDFNTKILDFSIKEKSDPRVRRIKDIQIIYLKLTYLYYGTRVKKIKSKCINLHKYQKACFMKKINIHSSM